MESIHSGVEHIKGYQHTFLYLSVLIKACGSKKYTIVVVTLEAYQLRQRRSGP
jgi:hypothetical protein